MSDKELRHSRRGFLRTAAVGVGAVLSSGRVLLGDEDLRAAAMSKAQTKPKIAFEVRPGQIIVKADGDPLATYVHHDRRILRPYFKDVHAPGAIQVTRHHPPREGIDPADHTDMHPGLWLAFGDISGADFWRNKANVEHAEFVEAPYVEPNRAGFVVRNRYLDGRRVVCDEVCEYVFLVRSAGCLVLWDSTFQSDESAFYFGDQEEMGLGVRVATPIMVKTGQGGRILDSQGRLNEKGIWGKLARWCDYSGRIGGKFAGVMIMPHPGNVRPCRWHTRDYGFMAANPFGQAAFRAGPQSKVQVEAGQRFRLRFGILIHAGDAEDATDLAAAYEDYLNMSK